MMTELMIMHCMMRMVPANFSTQIRMYLEGVGLWRKTQLGV
jgi:hypothetical protein